MTALPSEFAFLKDPAVDTDVKKILLEGLLQEKAESRAATLKNRESEASQELEKKRFRHNTPLVLALVGTISVFANGIVTYVLASRTATDAITMKQLEARLLESEKRSEDARTQEFTKLKQQLTEQAAEAESKRAATKDEREFAFKIIERELAKSTDTVGRAEVLLFLARAGILNSLNRVELEEMALVDITSAGKAPAQVGIPSTFGLPPVSFVPIESVSPDKVMMISEALSAAAGGAYTIIHTFDGEYNVREPARTMIERVGQVALARFDASNNHAVWIRKTSIISFRPSTENIARTTLTIRNRLVTSLMNPPDEVLQRLDLASFVKLTAPNGNPVWIRGDAVLSVQTPTSTMLIPGREVRAAVRFKDTDGFQSVQEDVPAVKALLTSHGAKSL
jgi:hypothetical protein